MGVITQSRNVGLMASATCAQMRALPVTFSPRTR
jgi:hypothetical protein